MEQHSGIDQVRQSYQARANDETRYNSLKPVVVAQAGERRNVLTRLISNHLHVALPDARILDVGCGDGRDLNEFLWLGASAELLAGNDLQDERLAVARRRVPETVKLESGDIRRTSFKPESFDLATLFVVLMTILDDETRADVCRHVFSLVKPGGLLVVSDPIIRNPRNPDVVRITESELVKTLGVEPVYKKRLYLLPPFSLTARFPLLYAIAAASLPLAKFHRIYAFEKPAK